MTKRPPFHLVRYFYTETYVSGNSEFIPDKFAIPELNVKSSVFQDPEEPNHWTIALMVSVPEETQRCTLPYDFSIMAFGHFLCPFTTKESTENKTKEMEKIIYVNGSTMLYGAIRDYLKTVTSLGPYKSFLLPTHCFDPEDVENKITNNHKV